MIKFNQTALWSLYLSLAVVILVFIFFIDSFLPLYYLIWVVLLGGYIYRNQARVETKLKSIRLSPFTKYMGIGILAILLEEVFASTAMHLMRYIKTANLDSYFIDVAQFWMVNLLALPGLLLAWYVLLKYFSYGRKEIFWLAGLFGLFAEKIYIQVVAYPLFGWAVVIPTIFTYGLLVLLPVMSLPPQKEKGGNKFLRYFLGLAIPILFSLPFIAILGYIYSVHPEFFPPFAFAQNY